MSYSSIFHRWIVLFCVIAGLGTLILPVVSRAEAYIDNETIHSNSDPNNETRRSDHFRVVFGHYNRDTGTPMTEQLAQGNLQMFEHLWQRNIVELGLNDMGESAILEKRDGNKYRTNFLFLMTWNDGGGGGAWMSMDGNGYSFAMANTGYCRYDPPSGATPHELGHCWEGQARGFNGSDSSGAWWECTANWFQLQLLNSYPSPGGLIWNSMYYPSHGRDYYDAWAIWEAAREDPRFGAAWINRVWTDATPEQQVGEYIVDRMMRVDNDSGAADRPGVVKDLWGDMAKKCVTWDYDRQQWFASANTPESNSNWWYFYQRCRTPLVKMAGNAGWYRCPNQHIPQQYGFNIIPLTATPGATVTCNFQPVCDPVRQSDWRACFVAVSNNNDARYSSFWSVGTNSIKLSLDETQLYLVVTATPKPMKTGEWNSYRLDSGSQFPYRVLFTNAVPRNAVYPKPGDAGKTHGNGGGYVSNSATVDASAYVGPNAMVLDSAQVRGNARIEDYAVVRNNAQVRDNAVVSGHAMVQDTAQVYGNAKVRDWARVFGNCQVYENAKVIEHANCGDTDNKVYGSAVIKGTTYVYSPSNFAGSFIMDGDSANGNGSNIATKGVHFGWAWGQDHGRFDNLPDNGYIYAQHTFEKDHPVWAWDEYGMNHGYLMNNCRAAIVTDRGGLVLPLNGTNQYVELHNTVNDWKDTAISVWVKWTGTANDQRIWSMGDGASKVMYLTPKDAATGKLRFAISNGVGTQYLDGAAAMPANAWTHVAVVFSGSISTLYVNGTAVASNTSTTFFPDSLNAPLMENANYLGRGNAGNYFQGFIDDFRVYSRALTSSEVANVYSASLTVPVVVPPVVDATPPLPNAAEWLAPPTAISDSAMTMSATPGTDDSNWVEYYFQCTNGGGPDSGWVSFNRYTAVGLTPGTNYTYTVKMRDKSGNVTVSSPAMSATTQVSSLPVPSFAYGPVGIANGQITMTATKVSSPSGLIEYKFDRVGTTITSGWQASPTWTSTGLTTGASYSYTVTIRDGRGNLSGPSPTVSAVAKDMAAPRLHKLPAAHWTMMPYATIDNKVSMTAMDATDPAGVQYYFRCTSGNAPDSGWQDSPKYVTPVSLPFGTYSFHYKVRDKSAQYNESGYSITYSAKITPTTGYRDAAFSQLATMADDCLVTFNGIVIGVGADNYTVKDTASNATITVRPDTYGLATDASKLFKNVVVKGHMWTMGGNRVVTYASLNVTGESGTYTVSGRVTDTGGAGVAGATVHFSTTPGATESPVTTVVTDANGYYSRTLINGTWYVAVSAQDYYTSSDSVVTVNGANVSNVNFVLTGMPRISGKVTNENGEPLAGAIVHFAYSEGASESAVYTATTDAAGNYTRGVDGYMTWYVTASAPGYGPAPDAEVWVGQTNVPGINFSLIPGGDGLSGQYFDNMDFTNHKVTRIDKVVDFDWSGKAAHPSMEVTDFSVRWTGQVRPKYTETYTFHTLSDDGVRLWVNNKLLVDNWTVHGTTENTGTITLTAGKWYAIKLEYFQGGGGARIRLDWSSPSQPRQVIPQSALWSVTQQVYTISGKVTSLTGAPISDANVYLSDSPEGAAGMMTSTDAAGNYSLTVTNDTWYMSAGKQGFLPSTPQPVVVNGSDLTNINFALGTASAVTRNIPRVDQMLFSCVTESLPASGNTGPWATLYPAGLSLAPMATPTVETINGVKWVKNLYSDGDGFRLGRYSDPIPIDGATITVAVKPLRNSLGTSWTSCVDIFYDKLLLGVRNNSGQICVRRNGNHETSNYAIPDGQITVLSMVVQPTGQYKVFANGLKVMENNTATDMTILNPDHTDVWGNDPDFTHYINVGRNNPDGWSTYNGNIGDVFVYKVALTDAEREMLEADIASKLNGSGRTYNITATAGTGGSISPSGFVTLLSNSTQTFTISPSAGYVISDVVVDGVSQGPTTTYTFDDVTADHSISVTFEPILHTISASAGSGGSISPSGNISVVEGSSQTFTIVPNSGYAISQVIVDGVNQGATSTYTFSNVTSNHTISATFVVYTGPTPVAFYQFQGNVLDTMNVYNGTAYNAPIYATGKIGQAIQFNGTNQYVSINRPVSGDFSIAFWVKTTQASPTGSQWYNGRGLVDGEVGGSTNDFGVTYLNSKVAFGVGNPDTTIQSNSSINTGQWVHVACTRNGATGQMKVYINGILETTGNGPTGAKTAPSKLHFGSLQTGISFFEGAMDHVKIFNSVLSASDVSFLANEGTAYTITASAGLNGSVNPSGAVSVNAGESRMFTFTPSPGYGIAGLTVDGTAITPVTSYTFSNVTADHAISATFSRLLGANNKAVWTDNNLAGKVVKAWGQVTSVNGATSFTIDDGYGVPVMVNVNGASLPPGFGINKTVAVTGVLTTNRVVQAQTVTVYP